MRKFSLKENNRRGQAGARGIRAKLRRAGKRGGKKARKSRRGKKGRRRGRTDEIPDADVVTDDVAADEAAGGEGEVCEVLMFDRGDGTYSLKFVQNKC